METRVSEDEVDGSFEGEPNVSSWTKIQMHKNVIQKMDGDIISTLIVTCPF